jgi:CHAP domain
MDRRHFLFASSALLLSNSHSFSQQKSDEILKIEGEVPPLPDDLQGITIKPSENLYDNRDLVGNGVPTSAEIDSGLSVLQFAPFNCTPFEVANYFYDIGTGVYGKQLRKFAREWPVRANPVIHHFFVATKTIPSGDVTAWCAAFLNWCLARSKVENAETIGFGPSYFKGNLVPFPKEILDNFTTRNAASGSFRCQTDASEPKQGDIAVFQKPGTEKETAFCRGKGHVAFFRHFTDSGGVAVLGGNQTDDSGGAVTKAIFSKSSNSLNFFGIKVAPK